MTCDLRQHGLIERVPRTFRCHVTDTGPAHARRSRAAGARACASAIGDPARQAGLAACPPRASTPLSRPANSGPDAELKTQVIQARQPPPCRTRPARHDRALRAAQ
jgi:hypothetical protein